MNENPNEITAELPTEITLPDGDSTETYSVYDEWLSEYRTVPSMPRIPASLQQPARRRPVKVKPNRRPIPRSVWVFAAVGLVVTAASAAVVLYTNAGLTSSPPPVPLPTHAASATAGGTITIPTDGAVLPPPPAPTTHRAPAYVPPTHAPKPSPPAPTHSYVPPAVPSTTVAASSSGTTSSASASTSSTPTSTGSDGSSSTSTGANPNGSQST